LSPVYSIAGKVFLLGEYAVLAGLPAIVASIGPRFELTVLKQKDQGNPGLSVHPSSPLGRLQNKVSGYFLWKDPLEGRGGLGASTAQFALAYFAYLQENGGEVHDGKFQWTKDWSAVSSLYKQLTSDQPIQPSGADLAAQWLGGAIVFDPLQAAEDQCRQIGLKMQEASILVFSATHQKGRKTPTHEHLKNLSTLEFSQLQSVLRSDLGPVLNHAISAMDQSNWVDLGRCFSEYAERLRSLGLEVPATFEDRKALAELPGVLGVKGSGAMQSDAILVLMEPRSARPLEQDLLKKAVIERAEQRGLVFLQEGVGEQEGVSFCAF
jgi:mevalonate kinase